MPDSLLDKVYVKTCQSLSSAMLDAGISVSLIYADVIYKQPPDMQTILQFVSLLKPGGSLWVQTDQSKITDGKYKGLGSCAVLTLMLDSVKELKYMNTVVWSYDWGGRPKDAFGRKHDDILWYVKKGKPHTFNVAAVAQKKVAMINSSKDWKIPTDVWTGNFYTTSKERIVDPTTGKGFLWQKPMWLLNRIVGACTKIGDTVYEPYLGTGPACAAAILVSCHYIGCDTSSKAVTLARRRLRKAV